jgi:hypothetical protein
MKKRENKGGGKFPPLFRIRELGALPGVATKKIKKENGFFGVVNGFIVLPSLC